MKNLPDTWKSNPFLSELGALQRQMDRLFEDWLPASRLDQPLAAPAFTPSCDVEETESEYKLSFDLPGVKKDDIKVEIQDNALTVSGERRDEREEKSKNLYRSERFYGRFSRTFTLPAIIKAEAIDAQYGDGVLRLRIPKTGAARRQQVAINEASTTAPATKKSA